MTGRLLTWDCSKRYRITAKQVPIHQSTSSLHTSSIWNQLDCVHATYLRNWDVKFSGPDMKLNDDLVGVKSTKVGGW